MSHEELLIKFREKFYNKEGILQVNNFFSFCVYFEWWEKAAILRDIVSDYNIEFGTKYILEEGKSVDKQLGTIFTEAKKQLENEYRENNRRT